MSEAPAESIRCTPRATAAEVRPALFHGHNLVGSLLALGTFVLCASTLLLEVSVVTVMFLLAGTLLAAAVLVANPMDRARKARSLEWVFTPQGVLLHGGGVASSLTWRHVRCLVVGRGTVLLHIRSSSLVSFVPRRALAPGDLERIAGWARAHGVKVRRSLPHRWS